MKLYYAGYKIKKVSQLHSLRFDGIIKRFSIAYGRFYNNVFVPFYIPLLFKLVFNNNETTIVIRIKVDICLFATDEVNP